jgi:hypothetical protein
MPLERCGPPLASHNPARAGALITACTSYAPSCPHQVLRGLGVEGVLLLEVPAGSPAAAAGLRPTYRDVFGDVVLGDIIGGLAGRAFAVLFARFGGRPDRWGARLLFAFACSCRAGLRVAGGGRAGRRASGRGGASRAVVLGGKGSARGGPNAATPTPFAPPPTRPPHGAVGIDTRPVRSASELLAALDDKRPGDRVRCDVLRDGKRLSLVVQLAERVPGAVEE